MNVKVEHVAILTLAIPGHVSLDSRDELVEKVRETAYPVLSPDGRTLVIQWRSDNLWDLRGDVEGTYAEIESMGLGIVLDMEQVQRNAEVTR